MTSCDWCCGDLQFVLDRGVPALIGPHCRQSAHAGTGSGRSRQRTGRAACPSPSTLVRRLSASRPVARRSV